MHARETSAAPAKPELPALAGHRRLAWLIGWGVLAANCLLGSEGTAAEDGGHPSLKTLPVAHYVGSQTCATCHDTEHAEWTASQHHAAMQEANEKTVLGNFENASFTKDGVETSSIQSSPRPFAMVMDWPP